MTARRSPGAGPSAPTAAVAVSDAAGTATIVNSYDEYGIPGQANAGRFQYTGQTWLPELGMYHYKARIYSPTLGRFLQTDPIGYTDGMNLYAYVGNDPVNFVDPLGLQTAPPREDPPIDVCANYCIPWGLKWRVILAAMGYDQWTLADGPMEPKKRKLAAESKRSKKLPKCLQDFLRGRISSNPANIRLHEWSPFEYTSNFVTFGDDIYLASDRFSRSDRGATIHKLHEIHHTSQYAKGFGALHHAFAYAVFGGHDESPLEQAADDFAQSVYDDYVAAGLDKTCPF